MDRRREGYIVSIAAILFAFTFTFGLVLLLLALCGPGLNSLAGHQMPLPPSTDLSGPRQFASIPWSQLAPGSDSAPNVLELPKASFDFVGNWGGYTHGTGSPDVESPDHVSVVFGRRGDTVFFATELYTPSDQNIVAKPRATIIDRREVIVRYKGEDEKLDYIYFHRFKLLDTGEIAYDETAECYDRRTRRFVGTVGQDATLHRLTTALEKRAFAQPSPHDSFEGTLSTSNRFHAR
jgi:hypothetical protein